MVCAVLTGISRAQVPGPASTPNPTGPAMAAPLAAASPVAPAPVAPVHLTSLPDSTVPLISSTEADSRSLHVLVGRSVFIRTLSRLRRVYVSNPTVVDSFTSSPRQIVVTAKTAGVSSLIMWDELGQSASYLIFCDLDVASLQKEMREALPNDNITVAAEEDRIWLSGMALSDTSVEAANKLAGLYTKTVINSVLVRSAHTRQVRLKVQIIEVDRSKLAQFGITLFSQGKNMTNSTTGQFPSTATLSPATGTTPATLTTSNPLNLLFYNFGLNVGFTLQDLQDHQVAQILAEPTITALSGQKASFLAGGEFPFPVIQGSSGGLSSVTVQFRPYGVKVDFTPTVGDDGSIQLKVAPEVSALDFTNAVTISGYTIPAIATRRAETQVELRDGQSFAISGLLDHRTTDIFNKMPGIGDVPVLGQLFRSKSVSHSVVELMVVVTPTIVDPLHDTTAPEVPRFPVPVLDPEQFDKTTGNKKAAPQPKLGNGGTK